MPGLQPVAAKQVGPVLFFNELKEHTNHVCRKLQVVQADLWEDLVRGVDSAPVDRGRRWRTVSQMTTESFREDVVLLGPLFSDDRLDHPLEARLVARASSSHEVDEEVGAGH